MKYFENKISDKWVFIFVYPAISIFVVHIGNTNSFFELVKIPSYYSDLAIAFFCAFGLGFYFRRIFAWINGQFPSKDMIKFRLIKHAVYGVIIPLVGIVIIEGVYLSLIGFGISHPTYLRFDIPISLIFLILINLIYLFLYEYGRKGNESKIQSSNDGFLVNQGRKKLKINYDLIAYLYSSKGAAWLISKSGEKFLLNESLSSAFEGLDSDSFFQLNRKLIASRDAIQSYTPTISRKLIIELLPPHQEDVFVSKPKSSDFITWFRE